jgi:hypothetical protein
LQVFRFIIGDAMRHVTGNMKTNRNGVLSDWSYLSSVPLIVGGFLNEDNSEITGQKSGLRPTACR